MSVFSSIPRSQWVATNELAFAIRDGYPVSEGHTLVIPKRVVASWFQATEAERAAILQLVDRVKADLDRELQPDGYNIGINDGAAAGQTVAHLHVHVIPRWDGDVDDPRGGVRFVIPERGNYKEPGRLPAARRDPGPWRADAGATASSPGPRHQLATGGLRDPFYDHLRPALLRADVIDIVAAFVQDSGVELLNDAIDRALARGAKLRVITGDYLHITQTQALYQLLDRTQEADSADETLGGFEVHIIETKTLGGRAFHPKSWRMEGPSLAVAWVGSSNWSRSALTHGVEWNLRVERARQPEAYRELVVAFDELWARARPLDLAWLEDYARRAQETSAVRLPPAELADATATAPAEPRGIQLDALEILANTRADGRARALVVLATGLGKTFLAAFDVRNFADQLDQPAQVSGPPRVLFVAHRRELLIQARSTFRRVFPTASFGLFVGDATQLDAQFVFASVQKLTRPRTLEALRPDAFDYVIIDECHHAAADSYRRLLAQLAPRFLLGLTATPERADDADVASLFDDHVAYRADLGEGIARELLVPFHYLGIRDTIAYDQRQSWSRYTAEVLAGLATSEARMEKLWQAWQDHPGQRTLVFCVSIDHADYVRDWLRERGVAAEAVHTGPRSGDRERVLAELEAGVVEALVAVDLFNEGLDVPRIDRVVMLRPTASPVVFLQQLGRGLRVAEGKASLQVIDFVGNHKVFLQRVRTLLSLSPKPPSLHEFLRDQAALHLPAGCRVELELEVIDLLAKLLPAGSRNETVRIYRELREARGIRPTPGELARRGLNPASVRSQHGHWYGFVEAEGDLSAIERQAVSGHDWLRQLERSSMTKSFKMVVLEVLLAHDALFAGMAIEQLCRASHAWLLRNPDLLADLDGVKALSDPRQPDHDQWRRYWEKNPIAAWTGGKRPSFVIEDGVFRFRKGAPDDPAVAEALARLTRHIVDWRLATYRRRQVGGADAATSFICKVSWNGRDPILFLPPGDRDALPRGEVDVRLETGEVWSFRFVQVAVNVARPTGQRTNGLPDLMRQWFGSEAGKPGTDAGVRFRRSPEGWWVEALGQVLEFAPRGMLVAYPSLRAAAGQLGEATVEAEAELVRLPIEPRPDRFAVRVAGHSMDGGHTPLRDGDWAVLEWARGAGLAALVGRVVLLARGDVDEGQRHHLKRVVRVDGGVRLRSDNPAEPELEIDATTVVIARLVEGVRPEQLGPSVGSVVRDWDQAFGIHEPPRGRSSRIDGHLFILVDAKGLLVAPDRVDVPVGDRAPAETAFVLTRSGDAWRYAGVGRWSEGAWRIPSVDDATWRSLGDAP
ncbi:DEAD/DEAH box helicase family protein [Enhygromyxa salina]|uniref:AP-4-A phosphorylase n=1 Tax=Enhygromyxa salina TaxID=215803 RepID=A0A2S9Y7Z4_9BACT|nr:DEAD/DEAH box helicase family protein [Enhygromyxa salina]PRQ01230.1 AP-4-A phosphorylase [Enhygromyxa salina]